MLFVALIFGNSIIVQVNLAVGTKSAPMVSLLTNSSYLICKRIFNKNVIELYHSQECVVYNNINIHKKRYGNVANKLIELLKIINYQKFNFKIISRVFVTGNDRKCS